MNHRQPRRWKQPRKTDVRLWIHRWRGLRLWRHGLRLSTAQADPWGHNPALSHDTDQTPAHRRTGAAAPSPSHRTTGPARSGAVHDLLPASHQQLIGLGRNNARAQNHPGIDQLFRALGGKDRNGSHADENAEERTGPTQHKQHQIDAAEQVALAGDGGCQDTTKNNG
ncbi:Hypothetical protein SynRCC307_1101 [Synechococcus sp. RCC307]|nr:Hypothetical protein SynRCC307_1101 [Synechococcus sp. RCC307]